MANQVLLIEKNAGLAINFSHISEAATKITKENGLLLIKNIPSTILDETNANGRSYSTEVMKSAIAEAESKKYFEQRRLLSAADDHPESPYVKPIHASHIVVGAKVESVGDKSIYYNDWLILDTRNGKDLQAVVNAGSSVGTSIRGLGEQDEKSGGINNYHILGTDAVGNPSAGTFAEFTGALTESDLSKLPKMTVESMSAQDAKNLIESLTESFEDGTMKFDLKKEIEDYKVTHENDKITKQSVLDLLALEKRAILSKDADMSVFETFKDEWLGSAIDKSKSIDTKTKQEKVDIAKNQDVLNKTTRKLEASDTIVAVLKEHNTDLESELSDLRSYKENAHNLVAEFMKKAKEATENLKTSQESKESDKTKLIETMQDAAVKMVEELQTEARTVIGKLEEQLQQALWLGDIVGEHFFAMKAMTEALQVRLQKEQDKKNNDDEDNKNKDKKKNGDNDNEEDGEKDEDKKKKDKKESTNLVESLETKVTRRNHEFKGRGPMSLWK